MDLESESLANNTKERARPRYDNWEFTENPEWTDLPHLYLQLPKYMQRGAMFNCSFSVKRKGAAAE